MNHGLGRDGWPSNATVIKNRDAEIESLRQQLAEKDAEIERLKAYSVTRTHQLLDGIIAQAAIQAREQQLREALEELSLYVAYNSDDWVQKKALAALALPADTSALEAMIAKAGECMRERVMLANAGCREWGRNVEAIRAIPDVKLENLK